MLTNVMPIKRWARSTIVTLPAPSRVQLYETAGLGILTNVQESIILRRILSFSYIYSTLYFIVRAVIGTNVLSMYMLCVADIIGYLCEA